MRQKGKRAMSEEGFGNGWLGKRNQIILSVFFSSCLSLPFLILPSSSPSSFICLPFQFTLGS
ncbi:hypothetical protein LR48_Vigan02g242000 [Vigna angularis]|nr:hypothetical protein LR48_Vigan02g242000 [Vigna angularis]